MNHRFVEKKNDMCLILMLCPLIEETLSSDISLKNICAFFWKFLSLPNTSMCARVMGKRVNHGAGYGLEILVCFVFLGYVKEVERIK